MYRIHQQVKARSDIKSIWLYSYENFGETQTDKYFDESIQGFFALEGMTGNEYPWSSKWLLY